MYVYFSLVTYGILQSWYLFQERISAFEYTNFKVNFAYLFCLLVYLFCRLYFIASESTISTQFIQFNSSNSIQFNLIQFNQFNLIHHLMYRISERQT